MAAENSENNPIIFKICIQTFFWVADYEFDLLFS